jgi:hypothetical protein
VDDAAAVMEDRSMKLRISNGKDFAITFEANTVNNFFDQAISSLRMFRIQTERRVHQGELHKTRSWFENPELHVYNETLEIWMSPAIIRTVEDIKSPLFGATYRDEFKIKFTLTADSIDEIFQIDRKLFDENCAAFWLGAADSSRYADNLNNQIQRIGDDIRILNGVEA